MRELRVLDRPASDGLLMAMVMMGMLTDPIESQIPEIYRASPLATAQHLHLYGRLTVVPATLKALVESINNRGGITAVKDYGMSSIVQMFVHTLPELDVC